MPTLQCSIKIATVWCKRPVGHLLWARSFGSGSLVQSGDCKLSSMLTFLFARRLVGGGGCCRGKKGNHCTVHSCWRVLWFRLWRRGPQARPYCFHFTDGFAWNCSRPQTGPLTRPLLWKCSQWIPELTDFKGLGISSRSDLVAACWMANCADGPPTDCLRLGLAGIR